MSADRDPRRVLVVDDERTVADAFAKHLEPAYEVETAYSGTDAIAGLDDEPDAILLDRRMPEVPGDEVLEAIQDHDTEPAVAMVTAVEPDFDIIDMGFHEYLVKPVDEDELLETVGRLLDLGTVEDPEQALSSAKIKRNVLEIEKGPRELAEDDRFQQLQARIDRLEAEIAAMESASEAT